MKKGFTLLELLAVVGILSFILIAVTQLFGSVLAGSGKTNSLQIVKQNGQFALSTMSRLVRLSKSVTVCAAGDLQFVISETGSDVNYRFDLNSNRLRKTRAGQVSCASAGWIDTARAIHNKARDNMRALSSVKGQRLFPAPRRGNCRAARFRC